MNRALSQLILSVFSGIDLLGKGFEREGFCVVRAGDLMFGQDVRDFHAPANRFDGVIGGSPCQGYSQANRNKSKELIAYCNQMIAEFCRVVLEASPEWFLLENVQQVPDISIKGYTVQRINLDAKECGSKQSRRRCFQFGSKSGVALVIVRRSRTIEQSHKTCLATEGTRKTRRTWADFCELQGLPRTFDLKDFTKAGKYKAVGNGVPLEMAQTIARAVRDATGNNSGRRITLENLCPCQCGRLLQGKQKAATATCRKRLQMARVNCRQTVSAACSRQV